MKAVPAFPKESDLCAAFIAALPEGWTAYPETGGFDILLVRADGFQIGIEAKLRLNAKVICQAAEYIGYYHVASSGPDCRAVLIPSQAGGDDLAGVCKLLQITVIRQREPDEDEVRRRYGFSHREPFYPALPRPDRSWAGDDWYELAPDHRLEVPEWVPDVVAGASAPQQLSFWKIAAIKIVVTLEKRGYVTRADFALFKISMSRWTQLRWIVQGPVKGQWIANGLPDLRSQHPINFPQIEADFEKWKPAGEFAERQEIETVPPLAPDLFHGGVDA